MSVMPVFGPISLFQRATIGRMATPSGPDHICRVIVTDAAACALAGARPAARGTHPSRTATRSRLRSWIRFIAIISVHELVVRTHRGYRGIEIVMDSVALQGWHAG